MKLVKRSSFLCPINSPLFPLDTLFMLIISEKDSCNELDDVALIAAFIKKFEA
jgi:hypothetical protein